MKLFKKLIISLLVLCVCVTTFAQIGADSANAEIQSLYDSHLYSENGANYRMAIPKVYTVRNTIRTFESETNAIFKNPSDMFIDDEDNIFVVDTDNARIVKMDSWGNFIFEVAELKCRCTNEEECTHTMLSDTFKQPAGIFVNSKGIYVADTKNERIVLLDSDGYFIREYRKPNDPALEDYPFDVKKVAVSNRDEIYCLLETDFQGFIKLSDEGEYMGNTGMTRTTTNFVEYLWSKLTSGNDLLQRTSYTAPPYSNFMIDDEGWIYATVTTVEKNQITKLNSVGTNVFTEEDKQYGRNYESITDTKTYEVAKYVSNFVDITVDKDGIVYALDDALGNVYVYDQESNNLAYFGEQGTNRGKFRKPMAIDIFSDDSLAVLDASTGYITIFESTKFCDLMKEGTTLYRNARYDDAREVWNQLLQLDANYIYAHKALGRAYYKEKNYKQAMVEYKLAKDKEGYSLAFEASKSIITKKYFFLIVLVIVLLVVGVVIGYRKLKKYVNKLHVKITTWGGDEE